MNFFRSWPCKNAIHRTRLPRKDGILKGTQVNVGEDKIEKQARLTG
jgi:hypothetical protein